MRNVPIKRTIERVPGGMMIVPLFTGAIFAGALPILAVFYVCMGSTIEVSATPYILKKGGTLFLTKIVIAAIVGTILGRVWGEAPVQGGVLAGLSTLAVVAAMNDTNGGLYMALKIGRAHV